MTKFDKTEVFNFEGALRGARNPLESWSKSDSHNNPDGNFYIGENDLKLAQKLILAGTDHSKFMRQIFVSVDITAPFYWWKEFSTYKVGTVANSESTMHKLATTPITRECFSFEEKFNNLMVKQPEDFDYNTDLSFYDEIDSLIVFCENLRLNYLKTKNKKYWEALIRILPCAWLQKRTITMSYQNIRSMHFAREFHKQDEWSVDFENWIKTLPYHKELILVKNT